ncbi:MAG: hypothetical protein ACQCN6_08165 [Candidatus Bathyarchaeia archaeon]|jgi:hypothetical protein
MQQIKQVGYSFVATASGIFLLITVLWMLSGYLTPLLGIPLFLLLAIPFVMHIKRQVNEFNQSVPIQARVKQAKNILMALPGVGLACWALDVLSTIFVIDISQSGQELNPLGWPYSAPVALAYYIPIIVIVYFLLYRVKSKASFYGAVAVSVATLTFAAISFVASLNNFGLGIYNPLPGSDTVVFAIWSIIAVALGTLNVAAARSAKLLCH